MSFNTKNFTANDYFSAAEKRFKDLEHIEQNEDSIIFSFYCSGVLIECIFRAYILLYTKEFDSKHNLEKLYLKSQLGNRLSQEEREKALMVVKKINRFWDNNLRYTSSKRYRNVIGHKIAKPGHPYKNLNKYLKKELTPLIESAKYIFDIGEWEWKN